MSIKKLLLLSSMALAVVAFAVPASASASQWRDAGTPITSPRNLSATGTYQFLTVLGGIHCEAVTLDFTIENVGGVAKSTGTAYTTGQNSACHGYGALEGCTVSESELTSPVAIEVDPYDAGSLIIKNVTLWRSYVDTVPNSEECGVEETELDFETTNGHYLTAELDRNGSGGVTALTLSAPNGGLLTAFGLEIEGVEIENNLTVDAPNDGTYQLS